MTSLKRILVIIWVISKYRLDQLIPLTLLPWYMRALLALAPWKLKPVPKNLSRGARLRLALQELGPIFIKFGQILSTRRDLLPDDIADEHQAVARQCAAVLFQTGVVDHRNVTQRQDQRFI